MFTLTPEAAEKIDSSRRHQIFPNLSEDQFALLARYGDKRHFAAGTVLYRQGERHVPMYVVLSGSIEVSRASAIESQVIGTHGPGSFTGEAGTLAGRAAAATARTATDCELLVINEEALRTLVIAEAELSETIMRAYILRRVAFIADLAGGVILIGTQDSTDTLLLREFMTRNGLPNAYFDIEQHDETAPLMARFGIDPGSLPAVVT
ncbi:MAG TPA: cyclic nucleotide-binding domain-containing protein, partial [Telluria sp.]|nr:cyclic nucleotide-binding domain-containing protein [Telluria sp.]